MIIKRTNGNEEVEYELTIEELRQAYWEYEHFCDIEDVKAEIRRRCSKFTERGYKPMPVKWLKSHLDEIAYLKRKYIDNYGCDWETATQDAIDDYMTDNYNKEA